jgi:Uma2 family endonuclease
MLPTALLPEEVSDPVIYPDSDGRPMADNTLQYEWIVTIKGNLDLLFRADPAVFVAGDHLIYAVKGDPKKRRAPDAYVAFGRPKGHRGSYKVWVEGGVFPQVIFEVLSPNNTAEEMRKKKVFYRHFGAEEYYVLDPDASTLEGFLRSGRRFLRVKKMNGYVSPRLGIRFEVGGPEVRIFNPDGTRFLSFVELGELAAAETERANTEAKRADAEQKRAETEKRKADAEAIRANAEAIRANAEAKRAEAEKKRAEAEKQRAEAEKQRADAETAARALLAAKLRELGIDPDTLT